MLFTFRFIKFANMKVQYLLTVFVILFSVVRVLSADILYRDYLTGFKDISAYSAESGYIVIPNRSEKNIFDVYEYDVADKIFHYTIRLKSMPAGKNSRFLAEVDKGNCGVIWNYVDSLNYFTVVLSDIDGSGSDIHDKDGAVVEVVKVSDGRKITLHKEEVSSGINIDGGYNSVCLLYDGRSLSIQVGEKHLKTVFDINNPQFERAFKVGTVTEPESVTQVKRIQFHSKVQPEKANLTGYTYRQIDSIVANTKDTIEGYWLYLDRVMDGKKSRLGGKYRLAIIRNGAGYDVLYMSGAEVYPHIWKPLMLKGRLEDTQFVDNYNAVWYDSQKKEIEDEGYATFADNILTIHLPLNGIVVRFQKLK